MKAYQRQHILAVCLLGSTVFAGCQLGNTNQTAARPAPGQAPYTAYNKSASSRPVSLAQPAYGTKAVDVPVSVAGQKAPQSLVEQVTSSDTLPPGPPKALMQAQIKQPPAQPWVMSQDQAQVAPKEQATGEPVKDGKPAFPRGEPTTPRKSYADITAHSSFGHAEDYCWISGEATKWRNDWRLRYASVDEVDAHGGSLTLVGDEHLDKLKDGEQYKLAGHIVDHDTRSGGAAFYVEAVQPMQ